jgi:hypothetical protein
MVFAAILVLSTLAYALDSNGPSRDTRSHLPAAADTFAYPPGCEKERTPATDWPEEEHRQPMNPCVKKLDAQP